MDEFHILPHAPGFLFFLLGNEAQRDLNALSAGFIDYFLNNPMRCIGTVPEHNLFVHKDKKNKTN